ncbi:MAG: DMT family transporter [Acidimicrobiia bacterium]
MLAMLARHRYSLSLTAAAASWGVATVISKRAVEEIPPLTLLPIQLTVSVGMLAVLLRAQGLRVNWSPQMRRLGAMGVLNPGVSYALSLLGLTYITASLSVLLWAVEPLLILVLAWWLLGDPITRPLALASTLALVGVILVVFERGSGGQLTGITLTLAGVAACAVYTVISRKLMVADSTLAVVAVQQSYALVFSVALLGATILTGMSTPLTDVSAEAWISAAVSGILYYAVAFWFYLTGLRRVPAGTAAVFINLIPVFGIAAGHVLLNERLTGRQWLGAILTVVAVGVIVYQKPPEGWRHPPTASQR